WSSRALAQAVIIVGAAAFALMLVWPRRGPLLFGSFLLFLNLASLKMTAEWQYAHISGTARTVQLVAAIRDLFIGGRIDRGIVIAPDRNAVAFALFPLRSRSAVLMKSSGSIVDAETIGTAEWVLLVGPYNLRFGGDVRVATNEV